MQQTMRHNLQNVYVFCCLAHIDMSELYIHICNALCHINIQCRAPDSLLLKNVMINLLKNHLKYCSVDASLLIFWR